MLSDKIDMKFVIKQRSNSRRILGDRRKYSNRELFLQTSMQLLNWMSPRQSTSIMRNALRRRDPAPIRMLQI